MENCTQSPFFDSNNLTNRDLFNISFTDEVLVQAKLGNYLCPVGLDTNSFIGNLEFDT